MKKLAFSVIAGVSALGFYTFCFAQEVQAPTYQNGDWWKVNVEVHRQQAVGRSGACHEQYSQYRVKIEEGKLLVYGISGNTEAEIDCPQVTRELLNIPSEWEYLKFPLATGSSWSTRVFFTAAAARQGRWLNYSSKVLSFENVKSEKGEVQAFKIERVEQNAIETYFYLPQAKAVVLFDRKITDPAGGTATRKVTLIDFNVR